MWQSKKGNGNGLLRETAVTGSWNMVDFDVLEVTMIYSSKILGKKVYENVDVCIKILLEKIDDYKHKVIEDQ